MSESHKRVQRIYRGEEILGFRKTLGLADVGAGNLYTFLYDAKEPGMKNDNLFDLNPQVILFDIKRSKEGKVFLVGANVHYLSSFVERSKSVLRFRAGFKFPSQLVHKAVHAYRADRIRSSIYRAIDVAVDPEILFSEPVWQKVNSLGLS